MVLLAIMKVNLLRSTQIGFMQVKKLWGSFAIKGSNFKDLIFSFSQFAEYTVPTLLNSYLVNVTKVIVSVVGKSIS